MADCVFCKIVAGEVPSQKVYEDEHYLAFLDINPINPGHTLVVPKAHFADLMVAPVETAAGLMRVAKNIAPAVVAGAGAEGFNLGLNNGRVAGQIVDHVHLHIMPRLANDGHKLWHGTPYAEGEAAVIAEKIRNALK